jgi:hypothetical protein
MDFRMHGAAIKKGTNDIFKNYKQFFIAQTPKYNYYKSGCPPRAYLLPCFPEFVQKPDASN